MDLENNKPIGLTSLEWKDISDFGVTFVNEKKIGCSIAVRFQGYLYKFWHHICCFWSNLSKRLLFYYFLIQSLLILKKSLVITINILCIESSFWSDCLIEMNKNNDELLKPLFILKVCFKASYLLLFSNKKATFGHL